MHTGGFFFQLLTPHSSWKRQTLDRSNMAEIPGYHRWAAGTKNDQCQDQRDRKKRQKGQNFTKNDSQHPMSLSA